ncbi:MAG: hypothetical protein K2O18_05010 [Oscillospiraceae bacterium]|nr:hypothetical protein [Oscillospiraceae bacterium]
MAGKENMFAAAAQRREQEQQEIEAAVTGKPASDPALTPSGRYRKRGADATTLTVCIKREDKIRIKQCAAAKCMTVSDLMHELIEKYCQP